jgi:hypothetical protein
MPFLDNSPSSLPIKVLAIPSSTPRDTPSPRPKHDELLFDASATLSVSPSSSIEIIPDEDPEQSFVFI